MKNMKSLIEKFEQLNESESRVKWNINPQDKYNQLLTELRGNFTDAIGEETVNGFKKMNRDATKGVETVGSFVIRDGAHSFDITGIGVGSMPQWSIKIVVEFDQSGKIIITGTLLKNKQSKKVFYNGKYDLKTSPSSIASGILYAMHNIRDEWVD